MAGAAHLSFQTPIITKINSSIAITLTTHKLLLFFLFKVSCYYNLVTKEDKWESGWGCFFFLISFFSVVIFLVFDCNMVRLFFKTKS